MGLGVVVVTALVFALTQAAPAQALVHKVGNGRYTKEFWTKKRMRKAKPMPAQAVAPSEAPDGLKKLQPLARAAKHKHGHEHGDHNVPRHPHVTSGAVPHGLYSRPPFRSTGKLYMKFANGLYSCSATVIKSKSHSTILTAGHCIHGKGRGYATAVAFVPSYFAGSGPHGLWFGLKLATTRQWVKHENQKYDYAAVRLGGPSPNLGKLTGELHVATNAGRHHKELALGYPNNLGGTEIMWACFSKLIGDDPYDRGPGRKSIAIACNMLHGCSGGPWEFKRKHRWYVNSVSSYFYDTKRFRRILFGPYFTKRIRRVIHSVQH